MRAVRLTVRLTPRGRRDAVEGWARDGAGQTYLKARVTAPPVDGAANDALEKLMARTLGVGRRSVQIVAGEHSRIKVLEIDGLTQPDLDRILG